ncbi:Piso0_001634 [Millerozyma farinosa CBS 7064]|uniref:Piso0_001634 protein n=1 Tax=Pichia sorbitophila (strain ATCC MYA-4447 / BCRC 22081 / CBS 7064 / NBRC 10061 / NRRL Y-12695) TaxID=559304 RepID=G8YLB3_PICSO|nr:Piso0_001634 [Millerozyma farinosa CBS 7064]
MPPEGNKSNTKFRRSYKACLNCRLRKVKCDLGSVDNPREGKCVRCMRERKDCVFIESRRGGTSNVVRGRKRKLETVQGSSGVSTQDSTESSAESSKMSKVEEGEDILDKQETSPLPEMRKESHSRSTTFSTAESALVFLAKAAGTIAKADERDNIDARAKHKQLESFNPPQDAGSGYDDGGSANSLQEKPYESRGTYSMMNGRNGSAISLQDGTVNDSPGSSYSVSLNPPKRLYVPAPENLDIVRPKILSSLSEVDYIGGSVSILSEREAVYLIDFFFMFMHPFFPFIPIHLHSSNILPQYPILLCAILTLAARYCPQDDLQTDSKNEIPRNIEIHDRLWVYVQRLVSQSVWAEASSRSIGTVLAFLLFTEWNPRAVHWRWCDYANRHDDSCDKPSYQDEENLAGLGAMRRSYRMAWMLTGSAVRLAQDLGLMEVSPKIMIATHTAEINCCIDTRKRSMLSQSITDIEIDEETLVNNDDLNEYAILNMTELEIQKHGEGRPLKLTNIQKAKVEILQIMYLAHESLYGPKAKLNGLDQIQNLTVLNIISPLLNNWEKKYRALLTPRDIKSLEFLDLQSDFKKLSSKIRHDVAQFIDQESVILDFHYANLFIFSLALNPSSKNTDSSESERKKRKLDKNNLKLDELSRSAKYIERAFSSANELLSVAHRIHKLKLLRCMTIRWLTRIVKAVAFIVKCYSMIVAHKNSSSSDLSVSDDYDPTMLLSLISITDIAASIHKAAITLRDSAPDELHICTRYSNILMYLCSQMRSEGGSGLNQEASNLDDSGRTSYVTTEDGYSRKSSHGMGANNNQVGDHVPPTAEYATDAGSTNRSTSASNDVSKDSLRTENIFEKLKDTEVIDWFMNNNNNVGLDFVGPWTEMIEQQLHLDDHFNFDMQ